MYQRTENTIGLSYVLIDIDVTNECKEEKSKFNIRKLYVCMRVSGV